MAHNSRSAAAVRMLSDDSACPPAPFSLYRPKMCGQLHSCACIPWRQETEWLHLTVMAGANSCVSPTGSQMSWLACTQALNTPWSGLRTADMWCIAEDGVYMNTWSVSHCVRIIFMT